MDDSTSRGILFLEKNQVANGSFISLSSADPDNFVEARRYRSTFSSALILSALARTSHSHRDNLQHKLAAFLLTQRSAHWSFNYWQRGSSESGNKPYPDDLDDTFCALASLTLHDPKLIDSRAMAHVVTLLTAVEATEGGPYRTWLVPESADKIWKDVDIAVNSNVAYFLSLHDIDLPNITKLIETVIDQATYASIYYPSAYPIIYFISRVYRGNRRDKLRAFLVAEKNPDHHWGTPLRTALAITSLLNAGADAEEVSKSIKWLESQQRHDGSWPASAFCLDPTLDQQRYYAGSDALTTAMCIEAITQSNQIRQRTRSTTKARSLALSAEQKLAHTIRQQIEHRTTSLSDEFQATAKGILQKTLKNDTNFQITLLAHYTHQALGHSNTDISEKLIITLGQANLFGWMAYTIYDDFIDGEGIPALLPVANFFLRQSVDMFNAALPASSGFPAVASHIFNTIDEANAWEVAHTHVERSRLQQFHPTWLPDYDDLMQLAHKSLGHTLPAVAMLMATGHQGDSQQIQQLIDAFRHYIIARQLNDDAHDWQDDIAHGRLNAVATLLLKHYAQHNPVDALDLTNESTMQKLQEFFWHDVITIICNRVFKHIATARRLIEELPGIAHPRHLTQFFDPVEASAHRTLVERNQTLQFIAEYTKQI